jgi:hypothetical protein
MARSLRPIALGLFAFLFSSASWASAQSASAATVRDVDVCELLRDPEAFDGQMIRFRGRLEFEFEGDEVDDVSCGLPLLHRGIWWNYGGAVVWQSNPQDVKKRVNSLTAPMLNDDQLNEFKSLTSERRSRRPDGRDCALRLECAYYDVEATFIGRFFAGKWTQVDGNLRTRGFGHMSCCHLFVIEQVSDVSAKRTAVPDEAKSYTCTSTQWQNEYPKTATTSIEERVELNRRFLSEQMRAHGDAELADSMGSGPSWQFAALTGTAFYSSPDLLTTYTMRFPAMAKNKRVSPGTEPILVTITNERCAAAEKN